ncbi:hypothetical protein CO046_00030 [Candidatus Peregrinibacteria bacterium CG_4_9_14_0_2_um_filter_53_11]|nr:MAG: hypothetical protein CO046_00030 [Candidatus Peregrinibacteria bacterium CG_4_9_14_0_2_um_filter_53_11]
MLRNLHIKLFALLLAALFWFFIIGAENRFLVVPDSLPVVAFNLGQELALVEELGTVSVSVQASDQSIFEGLTAENFEAYVDLRTVGVGTHMMPVSVTSKNPQVRVTSIQPREIEVTIEPVRERQITLEARISGQPAQSYTITGVDLQGATLSVSGAETLLQSIMKAEAVVFLRGTESAPYSTNQLDVHFYNEDGDEVHNLRYTADALSAVVTIIESDITKSVGIRALIEGTPADGKVSSITLDPSVVELRGPRHIMEKLTLVETEPIAISTATNTFTKQVTLRLPSGVKIAPGGVGEVSVRVEIGSQ